MDDSASIFGVRLRALVVIGLAALAAGPSAVTLADKVDADLDVRPSRVRGYATFVTARDGGRISVEVPAGRSTPRPIDFLNQYGHLFGVRDASKQLVQEKVKTDRIGQTHTTYVQMHSGVPVFSGELRIHQDASGAVVAANGDFYAIPSVISPTPTLSPDTAVEVARADIGNRTAFREKCELVIVDPGWYGDPPIGPHLAYHVIVSDSSVPVREAFFIDAHTGNVLDRWSLLEFTKSRTVWTAMQTFNVVESGQPWRIEGGPPSPNDEVNMAYDYGGDTYDFFYRMFNRDSLDDNGFQLKFSVHYGQLRDMTFCPNAFFGDTEAGIFMVFCTDVVTDDVVAHEMGHGITAGTSSLIYQNQPGQLNESYSDIWGEVVDLLNGNVVEIGAPAGPYWPVPETYVGPGMDTPNNLRNSDPVGPSRENCSLAPSHLDGVRWLLAEDSTGFHGFGGPLRDMWKPECYWQPSYANHPLQTCGGPEGFDNGGVHSGSGVPNHAFAILTDGKSFRGHRVVGIGLIKAAAVWYRAGEYYLTSASDFADAHLAINRAAQDLIGTTPIDPRTGLPSDSAITELDTVQVDRSLRAAEMNTAGACGSILDVLNVAPPEVCAPQLVLFEDGFESGVGDWTVETQLEYPDEGILYDWVQATDLPLGREGVAWFCDDPRECRANQRDSGRHSLISPAISIPVGVSEINRTKLAFTHYVASQFPADGGNIKMSIDGGAWELIPAEAFEYNSYNTTLGHISGVNPMDGERGWSGVATGWGTSVADLSGFVTGGESVRFRIDFGKDVCGGYEGWYVDDFIVYVCACDTDGYCDDNDFCTGSESCVAGLCRNASAPCGTDYCDGINSTCQPSVFWDAFANGNLRAWELTSADNTTEQGEWVIGNPVGTAASGVQLQPGDGYIGQECAYTGQNPTAAISEEDVDGGIVYLTSPSIDLGGRDSAEVTFARWFSQFATLDGHDDFFIAEVSSDNGDTWVTLETVGYEERASEWVRQTFQLQDFISLTETVKLRFGAQAETAGTDDIVEAAVDEVVVTSSELCSKVNGDVNGDCSVNLVDQANWPGCLTGPDGGPAGAGCGPLDFDSDTDLDLGDYAAFLLVYDAN